MCSVVKAAAEASPTWLVAKMSLAPSPESQTMRATTSFPTVSLRVSPVTCPLVAVAVAVDSSPVSLNSQIEKIPHFNTIICWLKRNDSVAAQDDAQEWEKRMMKVCGLL